MRVLLHSCLRQAVAACVFAVLVFGPLGVCCHEHDHGEDRAAPEAGHRVCVGVCACHFSFTVAEEAAVAGDPPEPAFTQRPLNERQPRLQFVTGIDHPPKN